ncbi:hypothetical protein Ahy_B06g081870 isoform E [Arachis hypogaea]|uniref:Uncharacterized protein n=1 Tax=Arachis hypogaea TaxID=3818 RepID=A0A444YMC6_ARAHY|nr:hypothetical protein Ahy_B06g081870 isoform E [Arachis hypogaea]
MSNEKKAIIQEFGFDGLLHIPPMNVPHKLLKEESEAIRLSKMSAALLSPYCELRLENIDKFKNDIAAALRASPPSMILPLHRCHVHQCFSSDDRVSKQKDKLKKHSAPGDSRKEAQAALLILLQSFSTLSSVEVAKQELLEIQEKVTSRLRSHFFNAFMLTGREQDEYEVVRKVGRGKYNEVFDLRAFTPPIMKNASSRSSNPSKRKRCRRVRVRN